MSKEVIELQKLLDRYHITVAKGNIKEHEINTLPTDEQLNSILDADVVVMQRCDASRSDCVHLLAAIIAMLRSDIRANQRMKDAGAEHTIVSSLE